MLELTMEKVLLQETDQAIEYRHERMTTELASSFGQTVLAREACKRLGDGFGSYVSSLREVSPRAWQVLDTASAEGFLVEMQGKMHDPSFSPVSLTPVFPVPGGFCSFGLYYGTGPSPNSDEEDVANFNAKVARLPTFMREVLRRYEHIDIGSSIRYWGLADIGVVSPVPYGGTSIKEFAKGSGRRALARLFGDLDDVRVLARQVSADAWCVFFDESENGDQTLFVALDPKFEDVCRLVNAQEAYDLMFEHYLLGRVGEFDFRPFCSPL